MCLNKKPKKKRKNRVVYMVIHSMYHSLQCRTHNSNWYPQPLAWLRYHTANRSNMLLQTGLVICCWYEKPQSESWQDWLHVCDNRYIFIYWKSLQKCSWWWQAGGKEPWNKSRHRWNKSLVKLFFCQFAKRNSSPQKWKFWHHLLTLK